MIGGRGAQSLGPLYLSSARHYVLPSISSPHPFPAARGPPQPPDAGVNSPARDAAGPGGWGRASPADCRIPSRSGTKGTQHDRAYACGCAMQEAEQFPSRARHVGNVTAACATR